MDRPTLASLLIATFLLGPAASATTRRHRPGGGAEPNAALSARIAEAAKQWPEAPAENMAWAKRYLVEAAKLITPLKRYAPVFAEIAGYIHKAETAHATGMKIVNLGLAHARVLEVRFGSEPGRTPPLSQHLDNLIEALHGALMNLHGQAGRAAQREWAAAQHQGPASAKQ
jgi:hypothetical protein